MASGHLRYPHLHGELITFVAQDDVWLVPTAGGRAWRVTSDHAPARHPRFSPDGSQIAYTSTRTGKPEVYLLDLAGQSQRQLTWLGSALTMIVGWLDDTHVVIATGAGQPFVTRMKLCSVSLDGELRELDEYGVAMSLAQGPDGLAAVTTPNWRDPAMWKRYRGGTASQLWLRTDGSWQRLLPEVSAGIHSPAWVGDRLIFSSDLDADLATNPDGQAQLYSLAADGSDLQRHTNHDLTTGYVRDPSTDGLRVVYHARGQLYLMDSLTAEPQPIEVQTPGGLAPLTIEPRQQLLDIVPDHGGDLSLVEWHGAVHALTHRAGPARALVADSAVRARLPRLLGRDGQAAWVSDAAGEDAIEIGAVDGSGKTRRLARGKVGRVLSLQGAPDGSLLALVTHDGRICTLDVGTGRLKVVGHSPHGEATGLVFSPDGRYLVWVAPLPTGSSQLMATDLRARRAAAFELTSGKFRDFTPSFTADGKYLVWLSSRTFDPRYSEHGFDLAFAATVRPYLAPLRASDPAPFGPSADGWRISVLQAAADQAAPASDDAAPVVQVELDSDGFEERLVPFPVPSANYADLLAVKDGVVWRRKVDDQGELQAVRAGVEAEPEPDIIEWFAFTTRSTTELARGERVRASGDGERLVVWDDKQVLVLPATAKAGDDDPARVKVDLGRLRRSVDRRAMWRQMFDENGRLMRDHFWREDMDGVDWAAVLARYRPLVDRVATSDDLTDLLWETVGELNTSHAYVRPPAAAAAPQQAQGLLGADLVRNQAGEWQIARILPGESSDPKARSPLRAAGVGAQVGDVVVAIDGRPVGAEGVGPLLQGAAETIVEVTLRDDDGTRRVAVVPIADDEPLRYYQWVASRAAYVEQRSQGRLGYLHVPDMMARGWAQFHRDYAVAMAHDGVIADMRYNGGGHTSQLIIERLRGEVIGWDLSRHAASESYPSSGRRGPVVFVANQFAGSDGDIVNAAAQELGLGPVVGQRTWGGVIGIDGRFELVDGTRVTQPRYSFHFDSHGWGVENYGVDPDIEYVMSPADWDEDERDPQLDLAIEEALRRLAETPAKQAPELPAPRVGRSG